MQTVANKNRKGSETSPKTRPTAQSNASSGPVRSAQGLSDSRTSVALGEESTTLRRRRWEEQLFEASSDKTLHEIKNQAADVPRRTRRMTDKKTARLKLSPWSNNWSRIHRIRADAKPKSLCYPTEVIVNFDQKLHCRITVPSAVCRLTAEILIVPVARDGSIRTASTGCLTGNGTA